MNEQDELFLDNALNRIHVDVPDDTFNSQNQEQAQHNIQGLFGEKAKTSFRELTAWYIRILGWFILLIIIVVLLVRAIHLLAPAKCLWLPPERISQIDAVILAALTGIAARFLPNRRE